MTRLTATSAFISSSPLRRRPERPAARIVICARALGEGKTLFGRHCRRPQSEIALASAHGSICSESAANVLLLVEVTRRGKEAPQRSLLPIDIMPLWQFSRPPSPLADVASDDHAGIEFAAIARASRSLRRFGSAESFGRASVS